MAIQSPEGTRDLLPDEAKFWAHFKAVAADIFGRYGYLPIEVQRVIADTLDIPLAEVAGVVTFYSFFSTQPRGRHTIRVCLGTACYVRGGKKIVERIKELLDVEIGETTKDRLFTFEVARCIGACGLAPAMSIDDTVFKRVNPDHLEHILAQYAPEKEGETV